MATRRVRSCWSRPAEMFKRTAIVVVALVSAVCSADALDRYFAWPVPAFMAVPPVPDDNPMAAAKVELGRHLFYDSRLSRDGTVACASCHDQAKAFTDGRPVSIGIDGTIGKRNASSLANVGYMPQLTWGNPHINTPEKQALVPLFGDNPLEMGSAGHEDAMFATLGADPYYAEAFPAAFPDRPTIDLFTITRALGAFQRTLISVNSPYDRYKYWGEADALGPFQLFRGRQLLLRDGEPARDARVRRAIRPCATCSTGAMITCLPTSRLRYVACRCFATSSRWKRQTGSSRWGKVWCQGPWSATSPASFESPSFSPAQATDTRAIGCSTAPGPIPPKRPWRQVRNTRSKLLTLSFS